MLQVRMAGSHRAVPPLGPGKLLSTFEETCQEALSFRSLPPGAVEDLVKQRIQGSWWLS